MIIVLTGQPRHGKSQYSIKLLLDLIKDNQKRLEQGKLPRDIYCNIAGINDPDTITKLPEVRNQDEFFKDKKLWFGEHEDCPTGYVCPNRGSVFIYDECHKVDWIKEKSGTLSNDPTCISMNEHGHEDYIFILITQFPQYVHTHLRGLVEHHYHAKRSYGASGSKIYKWNEFQLSPRNDKVLQDAYEVEKFPFKQKYQNCYKSASAHDSMRFKMPKKVLYVLLGITLLFMLFVFRLMNSPVKDVVVGKDGATFSGSKQSADLPNQTPTLVDSEAAIALKQEFALLMKEYEINQLKRRLELYEQTLPKDYDIIKQDSNLQVRAVISSKKNCKAYNTHGDLMTLSNAKCQYYISEPGRVHKPQPTQTQSPNSSQNNNS